jgi:peptidoglycan hydrolase CwlO-like protein
MRNDPFINPIETTYIASETQQKKITYLEQELKSSEKYISELEKNIELNNDTIHKLIQARSNHEILSKYYESTYKLQKKLK